ARSSAALFAFFNRSIATSSCSVPLAFRDMMASSKGKGYIITVSICNWNNGQSVHCIMHWKKELHEKA
ncbi:MAG: hypothetical protein LZF63_12855, partial [Nitrosomonas sp.]|nr:hypothetical protein [Nitrosomonas sp.]